MTASAPASTAHAYQASLTSQESSGTNRARPNASPQPNDARRLRPVSATTSSPGPATASGHASTGGNDANSASPPATEMSSAHRVLNRESRRGRRAPRGRGRAEITCVTLARRTRPAGGDHRAPFGSLQPNGATAGGTVTEGIRGVV